jgi:CubicO group peptidase (beta-lactamase class C family)
MKKSVAIAPLILLLFVSSLFAGETAKIALPKTDAGKRAAAFFEAFNSSDEKDMKLYFESNLAAEALKTRSMDERMAMHRGAKADLSTLEPVKILDAAEDAITIVARSGSGEWFEFAFTFETAKPHKLLRIRIQMTGEPDLEESAGPLTEAEVIANTEAYVDSLVAKDEFSGVVLVAKGETPVVERAYGRASEEYNVPNQIDTRFNLGSINKFFTRIAIEQLAGRKKLSLDDTIGKFLPDYPNKDAAAKVTIAHLLDMTGGIGDFFGEKFDATPKDRIRTLADYLPLFADEPLHFEPGTNGEYSNGGYVVLGLIVEKASGQDYYDYVQENICKPAGMAQTGHLDADVPTENVASGYTRAWDGEDHTGGPRRNNMYTRPARGSSAGGGYSTAGDLLKLIAALESGKLAAPETARFAASGMGIAGGAPGISASVETLRRNGYRVIVLSNYDPPTSEKVARKISSWVKRID